MNFYAELPLIREDVILLLKHYRNTAPSTWLATSDSWRFQRWMQFFNISDEDLQ